MRPSASAASVPGRGAMCSSQRSAVSVRSGSIATTCAPRFCASSTKRHWCRFVESRFAPHRITSRACANCSGSVPAGPAVGRAQGSARGRRADRRLELGRTERREQPRPHDPALHHAFGAREVVRQHRFGTVALDRGAKPCCGGLDRLVPADALETALALRADAAQRVSDAVGVVQRVEVAVDLGAQCTVREGVRAITAQTDGAPVLDLDEPRASVRAVQRAGPAHDRRHGTSLRPSVSLPAGQCAGEDLNLHDPKATRPST